MIDNWLSGIRALRRMHRAELDALPPEAAVDRLCELNVLAQARHVAHTTIVEDAWERGQEISIHSWIYRLDRGIITPLVPPIAGPLRAGGPHGILRRGRNRRFRLKNPQAAPSSRSSRQMGAFWFRRDVRYAGCTWRLIGWPP